MTDAELNYNSCLYFYTLLKKELNLHDDCSFFELVVDFGGKPFVRERFRIDDKNHCETREL